jgi:hypothetical protein
MIKPEGATMQDTPTRSNPVRHFCKYDVEKIPELVDKTCQDDWFYPLYISLSLEDRLIVDNHVSTLCKKIENMGVKGALELVMKMVLFVHGIDTTKKFRALFT